LYGTTYALGAFGLGNIFKLSPNGNGWTHADLYDFTDNGDGQNPTGDLTIDSEGNIYGTTYSGGSSGNGVVFELTRSGSGWAESVLWRFTRGSGGGAPLGGLIFDSSGNLYGTTGKIIGGANGCAHRPAFVEIQVKVL
jgi:uncharacterized repeat protein (TIGR03803 family)